MLYLQLAVLSAEAAFATFSPLEQTYSAWKHRADEKVWVCGRFDADVANLIVKVLPALADTVITIPSDRNLQSTWAD